MNLLKKNDFVTAAIIIFLAAVMSFMYFICGNDGGSKTAIIRHMGKVIETIELDNIDHEIDFDYFFDFSVQICADNGKIRFLHADCPDKVCVKTGWLTKNGDTAACIPSQLSIEIETSNNDDVIISH